MSIDTLHAEVPTLCNPLAFEADRPGESIVEARVYLATAWAEQSELCRRVQSLGESDQYDCLSALNVGLGCAFVESGLWSPEIFRRLPNQSEWVAFVEPYQVFQRRRVAENGQCDAGCSAFNRCDVGGQVVCKHTNRTCEKKTIDEAVLIALILQPRKPRRTMSRRVMEKI